MTSIPILSNSRMKNARGCLRYDKYRYVLGYKPARETAALRFGSLLHAGLEVWWKSWAVPPAERLALTLAAVQGEADPFERVKAEALLTAYHERWHDDTTYDIAEVLGVEVEFAGSLVNPVTGAESRTWRRGGKIDAIVRDSFGRVLIVEHKTSAEDIRQGSNYWLRLRMDSQVSTYFEGARILGYEAEGCIYDVIGKPKLKPYKATPPAERKYTKPTKTEPARLYANQREFDETPEEFRARLFEDIIEDPGAYLQRGDVPRLERDMREALLDDWHFAQSLRQAVREDRAPRNPDNCQKYGRLCEFFGVCTGSDSLDDQTKFVRLENPNTELSLAAPIPLAAMQPQVGSLSSFGASDWEMGLGTVEQQIEEARQGMEPKERA